MQLLFSGDYTQEQAAGVINTLQALTLDTDIWPITVEVLFTADPEPDLFDELAVTEQTDFLTWQIRFRSDAPHFAAGTSAPYVDNVTFFQETAAHELGHVFTQALGDSGIAILEKLWNVPQEGWAPLDLPWQDRVQEAIAETFKDAFLPAQFREGSNRTNLVLQYPYFPAFRGVYRNAVSDGTIADLTAMLHLEEGDLASYEPLVIGGDDGYSFDYDAPLFWSYEVNLAPFGFVTGGAESRIERLTGARYSFIRTMVESNHFSYDFDFPVLDWFPEMIWDSGPTFGIERMALGFVFDYYASVNGVVQEDFYGGWFRGRDGGAGGSNDDDLWIINLAAHRHFSRGTPLVPYPIQSLFPVDAPEEGLDTYIHAYQDAQALGIPDPGDSLHFGASFDADEGDVVVINFSAGAVLYANQGIVDFEGYHPPNLLLPFGPEMPSLHYSEPGGPETPVGAQIPPTGVAIPEGTSVGRRPMKMKVAGAGITLS